MSAETLERSVLERKDREQLVAIASALGLKSLSRAKKAEIVDRILEHTGAAPGRAGPNADGPNADGPNADGPSADGPSGNGASLAADAANGAATETNGRGPVPDLDRPDPAGSEADAGPTPSPTAVVSEVDEYGEPLADWEIELR